MLASIKPDERSRIKNTMKVFKHLRSDWFRYGFETLAVIVGILVAFALDNWNEERKSGLLAVSLLEELHENLESDVTQFEQNIIGQEYIIRSLDIIVKQHENKAPYHDSMKHHYATMNWHEDFSVVSTAYQSIISMGTENATPTKLKKDIAYHYDVRYTRLDKIINRENNSFANISSDLAMNHFRHISDLEGSIPIDYEALLNDPLYLNYLYNRKGWKMNYIRFQTKMIEEAEKLMGKINQEIEK